MTLAELRRKAGELFGGRRARAFRYLAQRVNILHEQRDALKDQRDLARRQHEALKVDLAAITAELANAGGRFSALDFHAGEAERAGRRGELAARHALGEVLPVRDREVLLERVPPEFRLTTPAPEAPGPEIAFVIVASDLFAPGLEALLRSLKSVYPGLFCDIHVFHDGSLTDFIQRRLRRIHDRLFFSVPDMDWLDTLPDESLNHRRVGRMGFMNLFGLGLEGYDRVILLDADLLILGDISRLWQGDDWIVCADCGDRDYVVCSPVTNAMVFNSGVISVPGHATGPAALAELKTLARDYAAQAVCDTLDRFSDQKIWNLYLSDKPKDFAPLNYNCNIRFLARALDGHAEAVSVLHFAGPKPWVDPSFLPADLIAAMPHTGYNHPRFWSDHHRRQLLGSRLAGFRRAIAGRRSQPCKPGARRCTIALDPARVVADPGDELMVFDRALTDPAFARLRPDHLVFADHDFFGGWLTQDPRFPAGYLNRLRDLDDRPALWAPFYFRDLFEVTGVAAEFEVNFLLFEEPFRRFVDRTGRFDPDPDGFLDDARCPALTLGVPAALAMGFTDLALALPAESRGREQTVRQLAVQALVRNGITVTIAERQRDAA